MKNILIIALLMVSVITVSASDKKQSRKEKKAEKEAIKIEQTKQLVETEAWQFDATQMLPSKGASRSLTTSYSVVLSDANVDSYLPYMGVAHSASYGGTDSPMIFETPIEKYSIEDGKKGGYIVRFTAKNKNDIINFTFNISSNGSATLSVNSSNRQHITYYGNLSPTKELADN